MVRKQIVLILCVLLSSAIFAQVDNLIEKYTLDDSIEETSGLIFHNNKLITHNDSGDGARLYEMDTISNNISRIITVSNATNSDWEDIAQDDNYIYIGDFGNNHGTRTDLKIYRINKAQYDSNSNVTADIINFSYEDQTDFTDNSDTNFDAEAMIIKGDDLLIFTKNRGNHYCNAYRIPKVPGTHVATQTSSYNVNGLITGAVYNEDRLEIFLTGYSEGLSPFIVYVSDFSNNNVFNGSVIKTNILGGGSQVEAIASIGNDRYFISREHFTFSTLDFPQKLYAFSSLHDTATIQDLFHVECIFPNPTVADFTIQLNKHSSGLIMVYNQIGKKIIEKTYSKTKLIELSINQPGLFYLHIVDETGSDLKQKISVK